MGGGGTGGVGDATGVGGGCAIIDFQTNITREHWGGGTNAHR